MNDGTFDFNLFLKESKETLLNPKSYFSAMKTSGGIAEPLIKVVIYGTITGILYLIWGFLKLGAISGGMVGSAFGIMGFIWAVIGSVIGLFIGAVVMLILSSICKGNTDFEANIRVTAALMVVMPIYGFFSFLSGLSIYLGMIVSLIIFIYSLWLLFNGLVESLKCKPETSKTVCYVLVVLVVLFSLLGLGAKSKMERTLNQINKASTEIFKDNSKN